MLSIANGQNVLAPCRPGLTILLEAAHTVAARTGAQGVEALPHRGKLGVVKQPYHATAHFFGRGFRDFVTPAHLQPPFSPHRPGRQRKPPRTRNFSWLSRDPFPDYRATSRTAPRSDAFVRAGKPIPSGLGITTSSPTSNAREAVGRSGSLAWHRKCITPPRACAPFGSPAPRIMAGGSARDQSAGIQPIRVPALARPPNLAHGKVRMEFRRCDDWSAGAPTTRLTRPH